MKKCPKCHADIEDNAKFCVFCMSSLQEKEKIEIQQENNKRWLYIIAAFLLLVLIFAISFFALSKNDANKDLGNFSPYGDEMSSNVWFDNGDIFSSITTDSDANTNTDANVDSTSNSSADTPDTEDDSSNNKPNSSSNSNSNSNNNNNNNSSSNTNSSSHKPSSTEDNSTDDSSENSSHSSKTSTPSQSNPSKDDNSNSENSNKQNGTSDDSSEDSKTSTPSQSNPSKGDNSNTENSDKQNGTSDDSSEDSKTSTPSQSNPSKDDNSNTENSDKQNGTTDDSSEDSKTSTPSQSNPSKDDNSNTENSIEQNSSQDEVIITEAKYIYRTAKYGDDYSVAYKGSEDDIVITGVATASPNGVYNIPEQIDGKRVIAIMPLAFCGDGISNTVKKIIVPSTVKTIWDRAFAICYNLTDIYFCGNALYTYPSAFAYPSKRTGALTIHCSTDCNNRDFRYYRNIADSFFDAQYKEWSGGDIK